MVDFYALVGVPSDGFDKQYRFVTSWLLPPVVLASLRALLSLYCFTTIFYSFAYFANHDVTFHLQDIDMPEVSFTIGSKAIGESFSYCTYLSYWGQAFYFAVSSMHTFVYATKGYTWLHRWPKQLQAMHAIYYTLVTCLPMLVTTVFWASMWIGPWYTHNFDAWSNISIHGMNTLFALLEVILPMTNMPPIAHLGALITVLTLYLGLAYLTKLTQNFWVYEWLDPAFGWEKVVLHIVAYAGDIIAIFFLVRFLIRGRNKLLERTKRQARQAMRHSTGPVHGKAFAYNDLEMARADSPVSDDEKKTPRVSIESVREDQPMSEWPLPRQPQPSSSGSLSDQSQYPRRFSSLGQVQNSTDSTLATPQASHRLSEFSFEARETHE